MLSTVTPEKRPGPGLPSLRESVLVLLLLIVTLILAFPVLKNLAVKAEVTARSIQSWEAWDQELP